MKDETKTKRQLLAELEALRADLTEMRQMVEASASFVGTHALDGTLLSVNTAAARALGYAPADLVGRNLADLTPSSHRHLVIPYLDAMRRQPVREGVVRFQTRGGAVRFWLYANHRMEGRGDAYVVAHGQDVTALLERAESELRSSQKRYQTLVERAPDCILEIDGEGRILTVNRPGVALMGLHDEAEILGSTFLDTVAPPDRAQVRRVLRRALEGKAGDCEFEVAGKGPARVFATRFAPLQGLDGEVSRLIAYSRDITERRRADNAIRESEFKYRLLFHGSYDAILLHDLDGHILDVNGKASEQFGLQRSELTSLTIADLQPPEALEAMRDAVARVQRSGYAGFETVFRRRDGTTFSADVAASLLELEGMRLVHGIIRDITHRKRTEQALRDERDRAQRYLDVAGVMLVVIGRDEHVTLVNKRGCQILKFEEESIVGQNWFDLVVPTQRREQVRARFHRVVAGEEEPAPYNESAIVTQQGEERIIAWSTTRLTDGEGSVLGTLSSGEDITELKRAEQALRDSEERYRSLVQNASDMIFTIAPDGTLTFANERVRDILGYAPNNVVGRQWAMLLHPDVQTDVLAQFERRLAGAPLDPQLRAKFITSDGEARWGDINTSVVRDGKRVLAVQAFVRDVTRQKLEHDERQRIESQIQRAQKLESLGVLAGGIAHDFNNLLAGILGNAGLVLMDLPPDNTTRHLVENIERAAQRAAELTNQMLAYSGRGRFEVRALDLNHLLREMTHLLEAVISKKAEVRYDPAPNLPAVEGDASQLRQVFMNLITNAAESLGGQSGTITISTGLTDPGEQLEGAYLIDDLPPGPRAYVRVHDTGCGMDAATRAKMFDPFFTTKFTGRGLGLAAVLGIVRGHRGAIRVESQPGAGTTVQVWFPTARTTVEATEPEPPVRVEEWTGSGTVLVVDDEETVRDVAQQMLGRIGFDVITATDGRGGIDTFRVNADHIIAVLLDLTMPQMDGHEVVRELQSLRPDVPVILSSGYAEHDVTGQFTGLKLAGFVHKPYTFAGLLRVFRQALGT